MLDRFLLNSPDRFFHRLEDLLVAGATAKVAGQGLSNLGARGIGLSFEQCLGRQKNTGCAITTLGTAQFGKRALQRMQLRAPHHPFHRLDSTTSTLNCQYQTGKYRLAIQQHGTGAALSEFTTMLGTGEAKMLP